MNFKKRFISLLLAFNFMLGFLVPGINAQAITNTELKVHFIDVGQADAILVQQGSNTMLIDGGNNEDGELVKNYISNLGIDKIDIVVGTHAHEDHIGGLDDVINAFQVEQVYFPRQTSNTKAFEDFINAVKNKGLTLTNPVIGEKINIGSALCTVVAPSGSDYADSNDYSIVLKVQYNNNSFLFTGDAEAVSEKEMLSGWLNLKADVLKVSHHGSESSTTEQFINSINPKYAVLSVGKDNLYGHPSQKVIDRLNSKDISIFRTDEQGTIVATSNGDEINFNVLPINKVISGKPGWNFINNKWYYLNSDGTKRIGWLPDGGKWYFLNKSTGIMDTGWVFDGGKWYYLETSGAMKTGWHAEANKWYFLDDAGSMATGWKIVSGTWYYFDGSGMMKIGWINDGGTWYYLQSSGAMKTGWLSEGGSWYYLKDNGSMATGWTLSGSSWYFMKSNGVMATGWIQDNGRWYYLYSSGVMAHNTTIDGYYLGADGAWVQQQNFSASVNNSNPTQNSNITLNITGPGGTYTAVCHYKSKDTTYTGNVGTPLSMDIGRAASGYTVIIDITINYNGKTYTTQTSFTPQ